MNTKEATERVKARFDKWALDDEDLEAMKVLIPELAESEDERVRTRLIALVESFGQGTYKNEMLAYLEKQKENPKSADSIPSNCVSDVKLADTIITRAIVALSDDVDYNRDEPCKYRREIADLKKLRDVLCGHKEQKPVPKFRVGDYVKDTNYKGAPLYQIVGIDKECYICEYRGDKAMGDRAVMHFTFDNPYLRLEPQPVEWGEEDEKIYDEALDALYYKDCNDKDDVLSALKGLCDLIADKRKVIPPYQRWKPSEEQIHSLGTVVKGVGENSAGSITYNLKELYEELKKL